jgi:hypothetical protein
LSDELNQAHNPKANLVAILRRIDWLILESWLISGEELHSCERITVRYTGLPQNMHYFASLIFGDNYAVTSLGRGFLWINSRKGGEDNQEPSIVVKEGLSIFKRLFQKTGHFFVPGWISGRMQLPDDFSVLFNSSSIASDINRIKRNKLTCQITQELSAFHQLYFEMYQTQLHKRYGKRAFTANYKKARRRFNKSSIYLIKKDNATIAAGMVASANKKGRLWLLGVKDGNLEYYKDGALAAIYYYSAKFLHAEGCRWLYLGATRAFLNDGVLCYKRKWGLTITKQYHAGFYIKPVKAPPGVREFLKHNPFIIKEGKMEYAVMFNESLEACRQTLDSIQSRYWPKRVDGIILYTLGDDGSVRLVYKPE